MSANQPRDAMKKNRKVTKRALQAVETRNRIYETALKIMESDGFDDMTVGQISQAANVSVGAFYHHFKSKYDILDEVFDRVDGYLKEQVVPKLEELTAKEKVIVYFNHFASFITQQGIDHIKSIFATQSAFFKKPGRFLFTGLHSIIAAGMESGEIASVMDSTETTDFLLTFARGIIFNWCLNDGDFSLEETMRKYITLQMKLFSG